MTDYEPSGAADQPSPEDPTRFGEGEIAPLDEAPDGQTPADSTHASEESLPPGSG